MSSRRMKFQALRTSCRIGRSGATLLLLALTVLLVLAPWDAAAAAAAPSLFRPEPANVDTTVDGETPLSTRLTERRLEEAGNETAQQAQDQPSQPSQTTQPVETETVVPEPLPATTTTTAVPTTVPTSVPTVIPTNKPTLVPTVGPTKATTHAPTTFAPTSHAPTTMPVTFPPTSKPTSVPTTKPTDLPTARPTQHPTSTPTIDTSPSIAFSHHFGDGMVLQRAPSASVVYGTLELDPALFVGDGDDGSPGGVGGGNVNLTALADRVLVDVTLQGSESHLQTHIVPAAVTFPSSLQSGTGEGGGSAAATGSNAANIATFRAVLPPVESSSSSPSSSSYSIYARCKSGCPPQKDATTSLKNVQFGDVWFCAGGSNMVQPLQYTFGRNESAEAVRAGRYGSIRYRGLGLDGNGGGYDGNDVPWTSPADALLDGDGDEDGGTFYKFSAACWYFAEGLVDRLGGGDGGDVDVDGDDIGDDDDGGGGPTLVDRLGGGSGGASAPLPIGLIQVSSLYSTIEDWMDDDALNACDGTMSPRSLNDGAGIYGTAIHPLTQMTIKGWVWYQGSTNMPGQFGNSTVGYACLLPSLIRSWRQSWSVHPGTTHPNAPFGLVTVNNDPTGSRGSMDVGGMRRAQTAGFGTVPNPAMPHAFWAQGYDLDDPYADATCYDKGCCDPELTFFAATDDGGNGARPKPKPCVGQGCTDVCSSCKSYCDALADTNFFLGPEQPRIKRVVGHRLAQAAAVSVYGQVGHSTGPTLAGCRVLDNKSGDSGDDNTNTIVLHFERRVLGGDRVVVQPYSREYGMSKVEVLVDPDAFCLQRKEDSDTHMVTCVDDGGSGRGGSTGSGFVANWVSVDVDSVGPYDVAVNLTKSGGVAYAVRYAWEGSCCPPPGHPTGEPCPVASCPLMGNASNLPANPFVARIVDGKCECVEPQRCDASIGLRAFTFHVRDVPINDVSLAILATLGVGSLFCLTCCVRVCCRKCCGKKKSEVEGYEMVKLTEIPGDDDKVDDYEVW